MKDVRLKGRPANVSGFSCAGRARRDPRQLQAGVGQRLGRTFSLLKEMTLVTDPSPGTGRLLEERNAAKTARAGEVLFAPTGAIVLRTRWRRKEEGNPKVARDSSSNGACFNRLGPRRDMPIEKTYIAVRKGAEMKFEMSLAGVHRL